MTVTYSEIDEPVTIGIPASAKDGTRWLAVPARAAV